MAKQSLKKSKSATAYSLMETNESEKVQTLNKSSKLETYVELLGLLAHPQQVKSAKRNYTETKQDELTEYVHAIAYLAEQGLVKKRELPTSTIYTTTARGLSILKYFSLNKNIPQMAH